MKTIIKILTAVLAVVPVLVSCYSEPLPEVIPEAIPEDGDNGSEQDSTVRVITVSFNTKATRTVFDETTRIPSFEKDDVIAVTDGNGNMEECPVYITESGYARINITEAALRDVDVIAVYPASVYIPNEPYFVVPSVQDGTFANANICKTTIKAGATSAVFENQTAIFEIDIPEAWDARCVTVLSLRSIFDELDEDYPSLLPTGQRYTKADEAAFGEDVVCYSLICNGIWNYDTDEYDVITDESSMTTYEKGRTITIGSSKVSDAPVIKGKCYVSVLTDDDVLLRDLNFDVQNHIYRYENPNVPGDIRWDSGAGYMGGFSPLFLNSRFDAGSVDVKTVQKGAIYTGVADHLHEYVSCGNLKWANMNVGATSSDSNGLYFAWGETTGHKWDGSKFEPTSGETGYSFEWGSGFFDQTLTAQDKAEKCPAIYVPNKGKSFNTLALQYDAAYQNWGGAWRMPRFYDELSLNGQVGFTFNNYVATSQDRGSIDFSNVGYGSGTSRSVPETPNCYSSYWTSTLYTDKVAYYLNVKNDIGTGYAANNMNPYGYRYIGHVIRPVSGQEVQ